MNSDDDPPPEAFLNPEGRSKSFGNTTNNHYSKAHMGDAYDCRIFNYEPEPHKSRFLSPLEKFALILMSVFSVAFVVAFFLLLCKYISVIERQPAPAAAPPALTLGAGEPQHRIGGEGDETSTTPRLEWR